MTKSDREIMEILEAFDLTRCAHSAAALAGCDPKTVEHYVEVRDAGGNPFVRARRVRLIDPFLEKIEELVDRSGGKVRADVVHERLVAMGFGGDERTTRRAVAEAKSRRHAIRMVKSRESGQSAHTKTRAADKRRTVAAGSNKTIVKTVAKTDGPRSAKLAHAEPHSPKTKAAAKGQRTRAAEKRSGRG